MHTLHAAPSGLVSPCLKRPSHLQLVGLAEVIDDMDHAANDPIFAEMTIEQLAFEQREIADLTDPGMVKYRAILALVERNALDELGGLVA